MHERSLVRALLEQVADEVRERDAGLVRSVCVDIGEFSGVEPLLFQTSFEELAPVVLANDVALELRVTPLRARCTSCQTEFNIERFRFQCPDCLSDSQIITGDQICLVSIRVETTTCRGT